MSQSTGVSTPLVNTTRPCWLGTAWSTGSISPYPFTGWEARPGKGYSAVLSLNGRWERGELRWMDPATMRHIMNYADMRERADAAEARVLELEEEIRRLPHR